MALSDRSVLDFCAAEFEREQTLPTQEEPIYPEPIKDGVPLKAEVRQWGRLVFTGFRAWTDPDDGTSGWSAQILGNRSDGQMLYVNLRLPIGFSEDRSLGDPVEYVRMKLLNARLSFDTYRDCSCGIIGYEKTGEVDSDGDPVERVMLSPCARHPKWEPVLDEEEVPV